MKWIKNKKALAAIFGIIAFFGFIDATYLTVKHFTGTPLECSLLNGCDIVTTSKYAVIAGVPIALVGALYYLVLLVAVIGYFDRKNEKILKTASYLTILGFLTSLWLVYLQIFEIKALCLYCIISATTSTLLFIIGMGMIQLSKSSPTIYEQ